MDQDNYQSGDRPHPPVRGPRTFPRTDKTDTVSASLQRQLHQPADHRAGDGLLRASGYATPCATWPTQGVPFGFSPGDTMTRDFCDKLDTRKSP